MTSRSILRRLAHQVDGRESEPFNVTEAIRAIIKKTEKWTPEEFKDSLFRAGIVDKDGNLTENYRRK